MSNYIPEDVVFNIIGRLPVKKIMQLTTTCKSWKYHIRKFDFIFAESNRLYNNDTLFIARYCPYPTQNLLRYKLFADNQEFQERTKFPCPIYGGQFVGCEHGLVCIFWMMHSFFGIQLLK
jgi:hypothetical protein